MKRTRKRKKLLWIFLIAVLLVVVGFSEKSYAKNEIGSAKVPGKFGIGIDLNAFNPGIGPLVKYWITDKIGIQGTVVLGFLTGYSIRGLYKFDKDLLIAGRHMKPYVGAGYLSASKKDSFSGIDTKTKGSGPQIFGGVEGNISLFGPNFFWTGEVGYSPLKLEGTVTIPDFFLGQTEETFESDYNAFDFGVSFVYYFSVKK